MVFKDEWLHEILSPTPQNIDDFPVDSPSEGLSPGNLNFDYFPSVESQSQRDIQLPAPQQSLIVQAPELEFSGFLNIRSMTILLNFIKVVISRINFIRDSSSSQEDQNLRYKERGEFGTFEESRSGSTKDTPAQVFAGQRPKSPTVNRSLNRSLNRCMVTKTSRPELIILLELSKFPHVFPQLFDYCIKTAEDSSEIFIYEFESLEALRDKYGCISERLDLEDDHLGIIMRCLSFGIQTLYGLDILHEDVKIVHSDISPSNVMFSAEHDTWKLIDFDQSMKLGRSLYVQRKAGTRNFIAPESEKTGIYTCSSDIFSLGSVMTDCINPVILGRVFRIKDLDEEIEPDPQLCLFGSKIFKVIQSMTFHNPIERPSAIEALCKFFDILDEFIDFSGIANSNEILNEARMRVELFDRQKLETAAEEQEESELKKPRMSIDENETI